MNYLIKILQLAENFDHQGFYHHADTIMRLVKTAQIYPGQEADPYFRQTPYSELKSDLLQSDKDRIEKFPRYLNRGYHKITGDDSDEDGETMFNMNGEGAVTGPAVIFPDPAHNQWESQETEAEKGRENTSPFDFRKKLPQ